MAAISQRERRQALAEIAAVGEVCEVHAITGDADLLLRVVARDTADLYRITSLILGCTGVPRSNTTISMVEVVPLRMRPLLRRMADQSASAATTSAAARRPDSTAPSR